MRELKVLSHASDIFSFQTIIDSIVRNLTALRGCRNKYEGRINATGISSTRNAQLAVNGISLKVPSHRLS